MHPHSNTNGSESLTTTQVKPEVIIETIPLKNGVIFLHGFHIQLKVDRGFLVISDGYGLHPRERRFTKAIDKIRHVIIQGAHGMITLAALEWLNRIGASLTQITWEGAIISATTPNKPDILLRRAQYDSAYNQTGIMAVQYLQGQKIKKQIQVLKHYDPHAIYPYNHSLYQATDLLSELARRIQDASSLAEISPTESFASSVYWSVLAKIPLTFEPKDLLAIPDHWKVFGLRRSFINRKHNENATNPSNAMLNYLYALLYTQTRIGLLKAGFDPSAGILHKDDVYRESFIYDIMEAVRPEVDDWLLNFIQNNRLPKKYFTVMPAGYIRLSLYLTPQLIETVPLWEKGIEPVINRIKTILKRKPG